MGHEIRRARPDDYDSIIGVVDNWWGRAAVHNLPRMFLDHFHRTSLIASDDNGISGFLVGFGSPSDPRSAYIHFVAVRPDARKAGLGRSLYEAFFTIARDASCGALAAGILMVAYSFDPPLALVIGASIA